MAAPPILLVADDLAVIAAVKRVLAREGYECVLATSAADAVIAWGHSLPGLILLQPSVESDRGNIVLEELQNHPDAKLLRIVLLGETVPGFPWPVEPLPLDPEHLAETIEENLRTADQGGGWSVLETAPQAAPPPPVEPPHEPDAWRATSPHEVDAAEARDEEVPEVSVIVPPPSPPEVMASTEALEEKLFGDLAADVEAEAMQSVESSLQLPDDEELRRLEDDVRAEAQRRRQSREARAVTVKPAPPAPPELEEAPGAAGDAEASFADMADEPPAPPSRAAEVLARAEAMVLETRAQGEAQRRAEEADARRLAAELEAANRRATHAEELVRTEREARGGSEEALFTLRDELKRVTAVAENERELMRVRHENELEARQGELSAAREKLQAAELRRAELERALAKTKDELRTERETLDARIAEAQVQLSAYETQVAELQMIADSAADEQTKRRALEEVVAARDATVTALTEQLRGAQEDAEAAMTLASEVEAERQRLEETRSQLAMAEQHLAETRAARDAAQSEMLALEEARDGLLAQVTELQGQLQSARADATSASELQEETARERDQLRARVATLEPFEPLAQKLGHALDAEKTLREQAEADLIDARAALEAAQRKLDAVTATLEQERAERAKAEAELGDTSAALEATRSQAEQLEATVQLASEKVKVLEAREVMSLTLPGRHPVGVARHGTVGLDGLAQVVCQLVLGNAEVKLELGTEGGTRTLWFKRGQIIAAESTFDAEGLIARARRDGLIDGKQDQELRMLRGATPREQLEALKGRGFIRDIESVPLVQRYTEQVALDAFTEESCQYRIVEETPRPEVLLATVPRPTLPMLAESLRRAVAPDVMLERLGGGEAVPVATDSELDLRALGFSERERKMLTWVDGEASVEDLSLASGLKPDGAFRALLVAKLLGIIEVKPGQRKTEPTSGQLDVQRLEAKYDEVQDADYFTILGLSRAAGSEDVRRAFQRLSQEFDPLRFSGHGDASLQQRAQVVATLLEEAARALEDDRRRVEYARHLLD